MEVKLKNKKLTSIGGSDGFIVDRAFINNGQLEKDKEYDLTISLSKHKEAMIRKKPLPVKDLKDELGEWQKN